VKHLLRNELRSLQLGHALSLLSIVLDSESDESPPHCIELAHFTNVARMRIFACALYFLD